MQEARVAPRRNLAALCIAAAVFLVAGGLLLREALFEGALLTQADALLQFPPWSDVAPDDFEPSNPLLLDQSIVMQPWFHFGADRVASGTAPWWNPNNYLGQPMVGTYQTAYFWPLTWLHLAFPSWHTYAWVALLRIALAGGFTFLFLRSLGVRAGAATVGGLAYALCGFMIAWLGHMHTHVAPLLPAMLWAIERIAQRPTLRSTALLGLFAGGALLAGHVQTAVHVGLAVAAYAAFRTFVALPGPGEPAASANDGSGPGGIHHRPHPPGIAPAAEGDASSARNPLASSPSALSATAGSSAGAPPSRLGPRGLVLTAVAGALGVLLAMPQLLPFLDYLRTSSGAQVLEHFETVSDVDPLAPASLMVAPGRFGSPAPAQGYGPYTGPTGNNVNYSELIGGYVGRAALVLALLQLVWLRGRGHARATWFLGALAVVAACVAWQVWPVYDLANSIPKLKSTKLMRASVVLAFALACLAAMGLDGLARRLRLEGARAAALFALAGVVVGGELLSFARGYNPMVAPELVTPATPVTDYLREQPGLWRVLGVENAALMPSANLFYDLPLITGYDSMETRTTTELVALMSSDPNGRYFIKEIGYFDQSPAIGSLLGVRYLLSGGPLPPPYELVLDGPTKVYRNPDALPRAFAASSAVLRADKDERLAFLADPAYDPRVAVLERPFAGLDDGSPLGAGEVEVTRYGDLEIEIRSDLDAPGLVIVTDAWDASWRSYVDGARVPCERVDHGLRGIPVDAGPHEIELRYEPWALRVGGALGVVALAILLFGLLLGRAPVPRTRWSGDGNP